MCNSKYQIVNKAKIVIGLRFAAGIFYIFICIYRLKHCIKFTFVQVAKSKTVMKLP